MLATGNPKIKLNSWEEIPASRACSGVAFDLLFEHAVLTHLIQVEVKFEFVKTKMGMNTSHTRTELESLRPVGSPFHLLKPTHVWRQQQPTTNFLAHTRTREVI